MAGHSQIDQVASQSSDPTSAPETTHYSSPQPRRFFSTNRISRRRPSSISGIQFNDINRRAILEEAIRQAHRTPPLDEIPALESETVSTSVLAVPDCPVEITAPSLSSSACSTPSAAVLGFYPSSEPLSLPTTTPASSLAPPANLIDFSNPLNLIMPTHYEQSYPAFPPGYPHETAESDYSTDEKPDLTALADHPVSCASSYAPSPALTRCSPAPLGSRHGSVETDMQSERYYAPYSFASLPMISAPSSEYSYPATTSVTSGSTLPYTSATVNPSLYMPYTPPTRYISPHASYLSGHHHTPSTVNPIAVTHSQRMADPTRESRCWDHGCNGRAFSTHSNFLRHQREKSGQALKITCPRCGAMFTRRTAMNGHMLHDKCKRINSLSPSSSERTARD